MSFAEQNPKKDAEVADQLLRGDFKNVKVIVKDSEVFTKPKLKEGEGHVMTMQPGTVRYRVFEILQNIPQLEIVVEKVKSDPRFYQVDSGTEKGREVIGKILQSNVIMALEDERRNPQRTKIKDNEMEEMIKAEIMATLRELE